MGFIKILGVFERKILRTMFGPANDNGEWRMKHSNVFYTLYKENVIVTYTKSNRLKWTGHIIRLFTLHKSCGSLM